MQIVQTTRQEARGARKPLREFADFAGAVLSAWWLAWLALAFLPGCAAPECPAPLPAAEAPAEPARTPPRAVPPAVTRALVRDSAAVQANARQFVAKPSTPVEAVAGLEPLTRAVNRSLAVMELHRRREGRYRPADVRAARAAADAVAGFLDAQPPPREDPAPGANQEVSP